MVPVLANLPAVAAQAAPSALEALKKRFPEKWRALEAAWKKTSGSGANVLKDVKAAAISGDSALTAGVLHNALRVGLTPDNITSVFDEQTREVLQAYLQQVRGMVIRDIENNDAAVKTNGLSREALSAKMGELRRVQNITGYSLAQLKELVVFVNTTSVAQLDMIAASVVESAGIRVR